MDVDSTNEDEISVEDEPDSNSTDGESVEESVTEDISFNSDIKHSV